MEPVFQAGSHPEPTADETGNPEADPVQPNLIPAPRKRSGMVLWMRDLLVSAAASVLIITFLYQPVRVEGTSMLPRLEDSDRLFINKFVYRFEAIERGDVVVFHYPRDPEKSYIKRVIALPGDRLRIDHGQVWLNGKPLRERYVPEEYRDSRSMAEIVIPEESYFMMGDHRSISSDSREFGPVDRSLIYGKAAFVYWPARDAGVVR
jgi:signal peptidase I